MEYDEFAAAVIEALNKKAEYKTDTDYVSGLTPEKDSHFEYKLWEFKESEQYKDALKKNRELMPSEETLKDMYRLYETLQKKHRKETEESSRYYYTREFQENYDWARNREKARSEMRQVITEEYIRNILDWDDIARIIERALRKTLTKKRLIVHFEAGSDEDLNERNISRFIWDCITNRQTFIAKAFCCEWSRWSFEISGGEFLEEYICKKDKTARTLRDESSCNFDEIFLPVIRESGILHEYWNIGERMDDFFTEENIMNLIGKNKKYSDLVREIRRYQKILEAGCGHMRAQSVEQQEAFMKNVHAKIKRKYMDSLADLYRDRFIKQVRSQICKHLQHDTLYVRIEEDNWENNWNKKYLREHKKYLELDKKNIRQFLSDITTYRETCIKYITGERAACFTHMSTLYLVKEDRFLAELYKEACRLGIRNRFLEEVDKCRCWGMDIGYCMRDFFEEENILSILEKNPKYKCLVDDYRTGNLGYKGNW